MLFAPSAHLFDRGLNPLRTAVRFCGQTTQTISSFSQTRLRSEKGPSTYRICEKQCCSRPPGAGSRRAQSCAGEASPQGVKIIFLTLQQRPNLKVLPTWFDIFLSGVFLSAWYLSGVPYCSASSDTYVLYYCRTILATAMLYSIYIYISYTRMLRYHQTVRSTQEQTRTPPQINRTTAVSDVQQWY